MGLWSIPRGKWKAPSQTSTRNGVGLSGRSKGAGQRARPGRMTGRWATQEQTAGGFGEEDWRQQGGVKKQSNLVN